MKLSELEQKSEKLNSNRNLLKVKKDELSKLETQQTKEREDFELRKRWVKLRGETVQNDFKFEQVDKTKEEINSLQTTITEQEKEVFVGIKEFALDVLPCDIPLPNSERKVILNLEGGSYLNAVTLLASTVDKKIPFKLDNVILESNNITIVNVQTISDVVEELESLVQNVKRLAHIALKEPDPAIKETAEKLHGSSYREIWEIIRGRQNISLQELYSEKNATKDEEMKKIRNFFTNCKTVLKENFPFICTEKGSYELSFFGALVWAQYKNEYISNSEVNAQKDIEIPSVEEEKSVEQHKVEKSTLNGFLDDKKINETLYGKV
ncbi:MAG: hypothetical protein ABSB71_08860 [Candidatus Bathyarchaeia archaeon]|jgi:hypothetical protein